MEMITVTIRGITLTSSGMWSERDLTALTRITDEAPAGVAPLDWRRQIEELVADAFLNVFPDAPVEWVRDGRFRLSAGDILPIVLQMTNITQSPEFQGATQIAKEIQSFKDQNPAASSEDVVAALQKLGKGKLQGGKGFGHPVRAAIESVTAELVSDTPVPSVVVTDPTTLIDQAEPVKENPPALEGAEDVKTDETSAQIASVRQQIEALRAIEADLLTNKA